MLIQVELSQDPNLKNFEGSKYEMVKDLRKQGKMHPEVLMTSKAISWKFKNYSIIQKMTTFFFAIYRLTINCNGFKEFEGEGALPYLLIQTRDK